MDARERHAVLTTGRSGEFRNLARELTNDPRDFPSKSALKASLAELFPGEEYADARAAIFDKLVQIAQARAAGMDLLELRGIVDEYVLKIDSEMAADDAILPTEDTEPVDVTAVLHGIDNADPTAARMRALNAAGKAADIESAKRLGGQS